MVIIILDFGIFLNLPVYDVKKEWKFWECMWKRMIGLLGIYIILAACGCSVQKNSEDKLRDVEFQVMSEEDIPEELKTEIEKRKEKPFRMTYADQGWLYMARGYGTQETSGYSIAADELYETENTICLHTNFLGPEKGEEIKKGKTYPYIVIKTKLIDKNAVFK